MEQKNMKIKPKRTNKLYMNILNNKKNAGGCLCLPNFFTSFFSLFSFFKASTKITEKNYSNIKVKKGSMTHPPHSHTHTHKTHPLL